MRRLTGIKCSGSLHLGHYIGVIKPLLTSSCETFIFLADAHGYTTSYDPGSLKTIASALYAFNLNKHKIYQQSKIPEIFELFWILLCHLPKSHLNRSHAYKSLVEKNLSENKDPDQGINPGLFTYPVLMAADILIFDATHVPLGPDQKQHLDITRDLARILNEKLKTSFFTLPTGEISTLSYPGLDGRKMSKSYLNTLPLFFNKEDLYKKIQKIPTDSTPAEEPKSPSSLLFQLHEPFTNKQNLEKIYSSKLSWKEAKDLFYEDLLKELSPFQEVYQDYLKQDLSPLLLKTTQEVQILASKKLFSLLQFFT